MSSLEPPRSIVLSPRARQDFIDILRYTGENWGLAQLHAYRDRIDAALRLIGQNPALGRLAPELPGNPRLYRVGAHVVIYRDLGARLAVVRILHQRMCLARHL